MLLIGYQDVCLMLRPNRLSFSNYSCKVSQLLFMLQIIKNNNMPKLEFPNLQLVTEDNGEHPQAALN